MDRNLIQQVEVNEEEEEEAGELSKQETTNQVFNLLCYTRKNLILIRQ
jgi:hypothetical protein